MSHGSNEGCGACSILVKNISSLRDKNPKDIIVVMTSCVVKSRLAISIDNVDLCSGFKETSDNISPATRSEKFGYARLAMLKYFAVCSDLLQCLPDRYEQQSAPS